MKENNPSIYQLTQGDKIIFALFFLVFPVLMILNNIEDTNYFVEVDRLFSLILLTIDVIIVVYLIIFRWIRRNSKRIDFLWIFIKFLVLSSFFIVSQTFLYWFLFKREAYPLENAWVDTLNIFIIFIIITVALLGAIMFKKSIYAQIEILKNESLQKSNELRLLKSQIDPHFLFNNLNTLDALIDTDSKKAKPFIQRLAHLYRYVLSTKDENIVELDEEMNFAKNYIYLIKERFDENYRFEIIDKRTHHKRKFIPPGALQTVFENIVKHNYASQQNPIITTITITDDQIIISNNIRSKTKPLASFNIGLNNLQARYKILSNQNIEVEVNGN